MNWKDKFGLGKFSLTGLFSSSTDPVSVSPQVAAGTHRHLTSKEIGELIGYLQPAAA